MKESVQKLYRNIKIRRTQPKAFDTLWISLSLMIKQLNFLNSSYNAAISVTVTAKNVKYVHKS